MSRITPGGLLGCREEPFNGKVFYTHKGVRHWVPSAEHIKAYGFRWPDDVFWVTAPEIREFRLGGSLPMPWSDADRAGPPQNSCVTMREVLGCTLRGSGVEFGAGSSPFPVPVDCDVSFADFLTQEQLKQRKYPGQTDDFVQLTHITSLDSMDIIQESSLDFVIACHVIEHTHNPLRVFELVYRALRPGGSFVLVVPDMRLTFDSAREATSLDHLVEDYRSWNPDRDILHFVEFFSKAFVTPIGELYDRVRNAIATQHDIHFHTWTYDSFRTLVEYSQTGISPWQKVWSHPPAKEAADANEFYYLLTK